MNFCRTKRTENTKTELVSMLLRRLELTEKTITKTKSKSGKGSSKASSKTSKWSTAEGPTLSERKTKAESARPKLEYANREAELLKLKSTIEAERLKTCRNRSETHKS